MAKPIIDLPRDLRRIAASIREEDGTLIARSLLEAIDPLIPIDKGRLVDSGFGYVDGELVAETNQGRNTNSKYGVEEPLMPPNVYSSPSTVRVSIVYHTPKDVGPNAIVFKSYGGRNVFDYAPFILGGGDEFAETLSFSRASPLESARISSGIMTGLSNAVTRVKASIMERLRRWI